MSKKVIILNNEAFAYYSGFGGLELHYIEYGVDDYIYCSSNTWYGKKKYHKLKIYYDYDGYGYGSHYIKLNGSKIPLNECIRV